MNAIGNHDSACCGLEDYVEVLENPNYDIDRAKPESLTVSMKAAFYFLFVSFRNLIISIDNRNGK